MIFNQKTTDQFIGSFTYSLNVLILFLKVDTNTTTDHCNSSYRKIPCDCSTSFFLYQV